jgi:hypothetical protein
MTHGFRKQRVVELAQTNQGGPRLREIQLHDLMSDVHSPSLLGA